jgi:uncharacterized membrane protein YgdD (TMEM256/DUF423 family)
MNEKRLGVIACFFGFSGILLGAFGAHALKEKLPVEMLSIFETAVRYQMYHVVPLFFLSMNLKGTMSKSIAFSAWFFVIGVVIFSGSLYTLALSGVKAWGAVTPLGGLALMIGWLFLGIGIIKTKEMKKC